MGHLQAGMLDLLISVKEDIEIDIPGPLIDQLSAP